MVIESVRVVERKEVAMPSKWDELEIRDASEDQFAAIPPKRAGGGMDPRLVAVLDAVQDGQIKELTVPEESQLRGLRVALGRGAAQRGFKLDYRSQGLTMYVRKSDEPLRPKASAPPVTSGKRGRPRKQVQETVE